MPDDNRFAGLSEAVDEDDGADEDGVTDGNGETNDESPSESEEQSTAASGAADDSDTDSSSSTEHEFTSEVASDTKSDGATGSVSGESDSDESVATDSSSREDSSKADDPTAFPFDDTKKKTVYVRPETLDEVEDARALVDAQLRTQHDVRDLTGREFYDATLRLAAADTDGLIEAVLEAREE